MINTNWNPLKLIGLALVVFMGCGDDMDDNLEPPVNLSFSFTHHWDGTPVSSADFNDFKFTTEAGDLVSIERLRYVVSDIQLINSNGQVQELDTYNLVDLTNGEGLEFASTANFSQGAFQVMLTFGFDDEDNAKNYPELNVASFNVPEMLGGGYHYMQFDGKYINLEGNAAPFNYHAIRAVDISSGAPVFPQDTFFSIDLGEVNITQNTEIEVSVDLSEWFKNPNLWQLNDLNTVLMPNPDAQILMYENGKAGVFSN